MDMLRKFVRVDNDTALGERQIRIIASDATVDRVNDVMVPEGCDVTDYMANPIILAQHDPNHPIGKCQVSIVNGRVEALIDFAPAGVSPKADEYCGLAKSGIINAASVGFEGVEFEPIKGGGRRFTKWKLMEISLVSVPANPSALVIARSADQPGTKDAKVQLKVGASRNLAVEAGTSWDSASAAESIFAKCGFDGADPDATLARKGFLIYDAANPTLKASYRLPFAKVENGRLVACAAALGVSRVLLNTTDIPDEAREKARAVIDHYEGKMGAKSQPVFTLKGLYDCAELASVLMRLGWIHDAAKWEQEVEGDASKLPEMLGAILSQAGAALVAMTQEEVAELLAGHDVEVLPADAAYVEAGATPQIKALRAAMRKAGRVMSQANRDHLEAVAKCLGKMTDCLTKAADLHDELHDQIEGMKDHGTSLGEHVKAMCDSADGRKPKDDDDDSQDDSGDDGDDPEATDGELAFAAAGRKRALVLLELAK